jgi:hypothetical protein
MMPSFNEGKSENAYAQIHLLNEVSQALLWLSASWEIGIRVLPERKKLMLVARCLCRRSA